MERTLRCLIALFWIELIKTRNPANIRDYSKSGDEGRHENLTIWADEWVTNMKQLLVPE